MGHSDAEIPLRVERENELVMSRGIAVQGAEMLAAAGAKKAHRQP